MRFPLRLSKYYNVARVFMCLLIALSIAMIVISILTLCGVYTFLNLTFAQAKIQLVTFCLSAIVMIALLTMHYQIDDKHLRIKLMFLDILGGRIRIENILNIVYSDGQMYVSYIWKGTDPVIAAIMIAPSKFGQMKSALMEKNKNIVFYEDKDEISDSQQ